MVFSLRTGKSGRARLPSSVCRIENVVIDLPQYLLWSTKMNRQRTKKGAWQSQTPSMLRLECGAI